MIQRLALTSHWIWWHIFCFYYKEVREIYVACTASGHQRLKAYIAAFRIFRLCAWNPLCGMTLSFCSSWLSLRSRAHHWRSRTSNSSSSNSRKEEGSRKPCGQWSVQVVTGAMAMSIAQCSSAAFQIQELCRQVRHGTDQTWGGWRLNFESYPFKRYPFVRKKVPSSHVGKSPGPKSMLGLAVLCLSVNVTEDP